MFSEQRDGFIFFKIDIYYIYIITYSVETNSRQGLPILAGELIILKGYNNNMNYFIISSGLLQTIVILKLDRSNIIDGYFESIAKLQR